MKKLIAAAVGALITCVLSGISPVYAQDGPSVHVSNEADLRTALEQHQALTIVLDNDVAITSEIQVRDHTIKIFGGNHRIYAAENLGSMFKFESTSLSAEDLILDGANRARIANVEMNSSLTFTHSTITGGNSAYATEHSEGGALYVVGSTVKLSDSVISHSQTHKNPATPEESSPHGGAIYAINSNLNLSTVEVAHNKVGSGVGHGGAIYIENTQLHISGSHFHDNKMHTKAIITGASIYGGNGATVTIEADSQGHRTKFDVVGPFNTGGAIRLLSSRATISDTDFLIMDTNGDSYATTAGAICVEGSGLNVSNSTFKFKNPSTNNAKLDFAGGFIAAIGEIQEFNISDCVFEGRGKGNGRGAATYGGAITFESRADKTNYTYGNATITRTTFSNFTADQWGGTIALSTKPSEQNGVTLTLDSCTITDSATLFWGNQHGGGIAVGPGNTLIMKNSSITGATSAYGGGIYNEGSVQLLDNTKITNNLGYFLGGGVYNDGDLLVDYARFEGNTRGDWSTGPYHPDTANGPIKEYAGASIYAHKSLTITPEASFDSKDVRIIPGISRIYLTGAMQNIVPVSIAEGNTQEGAHRFLGAIFAEGKDYEVTESDATYIHYISADTTQPVAEQQDSESLATWDALKSYLTDTTSDNTIRLGQRVKLTQHPNSNGKDDIRFAWLNTAISPGERFEKLSTIVSLTHPDRLLKAEDRVVNPERPGFDFVNWYSRPVTDEDVANDKTKDVALYIVRGGEEITTPINPAEIDVYAGWEKFVEIPGTTVSYGTNSASADSKLLVSLTAEELTTGISLEDKVELTGMSTKQQYRLVTVLNELEAGSATPIKTLIHPETISSDSAEKTIKVQINLNNQLVSFGKNYVIYEYLLPANYKLQTTEDTPGLNEADLPYVLAKHADAADLSQSFSLTEKVFTPATVTISMKKVLEGRDFKADDRFIFMLHSNDKEAPLPAKNTLEVSDGKIYHFDEINFNKEGVYHYDIEEMLESNSHMVVPDLTPVTVTVTLEGTIYKANVSYPDDAEHAVITNKYPTLSTLISVDGTAAKKATDTEPAKSVEVVEGTHHVTDELSYTNLIPNESYRIISKLVKVANGTTETVKKLSQDFTTSEQNGSITIDFGELELEPNVSYVAFERINYSADADNESEEPVTGLPEERLIMAQPAEWLIHEDINDLAQTITVTSKPVDPKPDPAPDPNPIPEPQPKPDPQPPVTPSEKLYIPPSNIVPHEDHYLPRTGEKSQNMLLLLVAGSASLLGAAALRYRRSHLNSRN